MKSIGLKIAQVSRVMGGKIGKEGPPQAGQEVFLKLLNNNGARSYSLLVGVYKVLFNIDSPLDGEYNWLLDQTNLMNIGCTLTLSLYPLQGILEVHNDVVVIEDGADCATLIQLPDPTCYCSHGGGEE